MYEEPFEVKALNSNFELVSLIMYNNLQWTRKFHECGQFTIVLTGRQYDKSWKYIYAEARKELGVISQVNWSKENYIEQTIISGYFLENEVNNMLVYPKPKQFLEDTNAKATCLSNQTSPTWTMQIGDADVVAKKFFDDFKSITWTNYDFEDVTGNNLVTTTKTLDISFGSIENGDYHHAEHSRNGERLGDKIYKILKPSGASYEIIFDYMDHTKVMNFIHGKDLREDNEDGNNPVVFTSANGNIISASLVVSNTDTKDAVISYTSSEDNVLVLINKKSDSIGRFTKNGLTTSLDDYFTDKDNPTAAEDKNFKLAVMANSEEVVKNYEDKQNIEFKIYRGSYKYMEDYDLGDLISIEINEIGLSVDARIVACYEVVKKGVWELTLEIGTPLRVNYI